MSIEITKTFEIGISGNYQSYRFGSAETVKLPDTASNEEVEFTRVRLFDSLVESTIGDVKAYADGSEDFKLVLAARKDGLDKLRILLTKSGVNNIETSEVFKG